MLKYSQNRYFIFGVGLVSYITVCYFLSPISAKIPHIAGAIIYFILGIFLFRILYQAFFILLLFSPFLISVIISLTNNKGLFPEVVPLLILTCLVGFLIGSLTMKAFLNKEKKKLVGMVTVFLGLVFFMTEIVIPRIVLYKLTPSAAIKLGNRKNFRFVDKGLDSIKVELSDISIFDFWHTRCGSCYPNNDFLNSIAFKYKSLGVKFYLIYMGNIDSVKRFQESSFDSRWENLIHLYDPNGSVSKSLKFLGAPRTIIVSNGEVVFNQLGFSSESSSLEAVKIEEILMGKIHSNSDLRTLISGETNSINLGKLSNSDTTPHIFRLKNIFPEPLILQDIRSSCNCLIADWTKTPVKGDEYGYITIQVNPDQEKVNQIETIVFETNSMKKPFTIVNVSFEAVGI